MAKKTYDAPGMLDFRVRLRAGRAGITIDFTGGRTSGEVTRWATYSTDDVVMQRIIEESPEFKSGRIRRTR